MIWPTTPTGSRRIIEVEPRTYSAAAWPSGVRAAPAMNRRQSDAPATSSTAAARGLPTFSDSSSPSSSACSSSASASLFRTSHRSAGVVSPQSPKKARSAASTALSMSSAVEFGTAAITSPVAGLTTSMVSPEVESAALPLMWFENRFSATLMSRLPVADGLDRTPGQSAR